MILNVLNALLVSAGLLSVAVSSSEAQQAIKSGGVISGELRAMSNRGPKGKNVNTFQLVSEPRKLPGPNGHCNLETGPEIFQIVISSEAEETQLKDFIGKKISIKANEISCAELEGQVSDAIVSKWTLVKSR